MLAWLLSIHLFSTFCFLPQGACSLFLIDSAYVTWSLDERLQFNYLLLIADSVLICHQRYHRVLTWALELQLQSN